MSTYKLIVNLAKSNKSSSVGTFFYLLLTSPVSHVYKYPLPPQQQHLSWELGKNSSGTLLMIRQLYWLNLTPCLLVILAEVKGMVY